MAKVLQAHYKTFLQRQTFAEIFRSVGTVTVNSFPLSQEALAAAKPFEEIPGYKVLPFLGTTWVFLPFVGKYSLKGSHIYDRAKYEKFGPVTRDKFGKHFDLVTIYDPNDIETVFRNESKYPSRGEFSSLKVYREMRKKWFTTMGVLVLNGKEWKDLRFKLQKNMLKPKVISSYVKPMAQVAEDLVRAIRNKKNHNNEVPNLLDELYKWALESVGYVALDTRLGCLNEQPNEEALKMIKGAQLTFEYMNKLEAFTGNIQYWKWFSTPTWKKFVDIMDFFSETGFKYVGRALEEVKDKSVSEEDMTLLQSMLATEGLDVSGVVTMIIDMLMAGVDTTSHTVGFLLYDLAKHPDKQEKMYQEIKSLLPTSSERITSEVLKQLVYVKYCMKESQRLNPVARGNARFLEKDMVLGGYKVPAGTHVFGGLQVTQTQEKYFQNAKEFIPERWMDENNKSHPFAFMPFGFGIRSCIGRRIAELEVQCAAIEIIRNFKVEYHHEDIGMVTRLVNLPDRPLLFNFLERRN